MENFICNHYGEKLAILNTENIKICRSITKLEATKMQLFAFSSISAEEGLSYGFCSKFHTLSSSAKLWKIG